MADKTIKMLLVGEDRSASKTLKGVGDAAEKTGGRLSRMGEIAGGVLGADLLRSAGSAILDFASKSVESASRAEQAFGGVGAVFGDQADQITKSAEGAAQALGLSEVAYSELATTLGAGLKNKGIEDYAAKTEDLLVVGADLAAQFGGSTADAVGALSSALRGEMDPIERYGVAMNQAAIEAKALSLGLGSSTVDIGKVAVAQKRAEVAQMNYNEAVKKHGAESKEAASASASLMSSQQSLENAMAGGKTTLTDQEKATAALALITEQTADAQGAFARESETLAGKQQRLAAEYENMQSTLGTMLLPILTDLTGVLMEVVSYVQQNADWLGPLAAGFGAVTAAVWLVNAALAANPIGIVVIAIAALVAGLVVAYNESETFRNIVDGAFRAIGDAGAWLWNNALMPAFKAILGGFAWVTDGLANMLDALGNIPGFEWAKDAAGKLRDLADKARSAASGLNEIPNSKTVNVSANTASYDRAVANINGRTLTTYVQMKVYGQGAVATGGYGGDVANAIGLAGGGTARSRFSGVVNGPGTTTSDSIPAWLSRKEFVTNAAATDYYGTDVMYAMNARAIPREFFGAMGFAGGGSPGGAGFAQAGAPAGDTYNVNLEGREALQWVMTHLADGRRRTYQGEARHV